jgi:hypothetical protein
MSKPVDNPRRLFETEDSAGLGRLFRSARELPDEELPTLRWRLRTSQHLRATRQRLFLRVALVVGLAFCMGGVVGAVVSPFWAKKEPKEPKEPAVVRPTPGEASPSRHGKARPVTSLPATPALSEPIPDHAEPLVGEPRAVPEEPRVGPDQPRAVVEEPRPAPDEPKSVSDEPRSIPDAPRPVPARVRPRAGVRVALLNEATPPAAPGLAPEMAPPPLAPPPLAAAPLASSPIAAEQALLGQAMRTLRDRHDARTALAWLARHAERFPDGALASEATMLRIEALLALGRREEALSVLDGAPLGSLPNRPTRHQRQGPDHPGTRAVGPRRRA